MKWRWHWRFAILAEEQYRVTNPPPLDMGRTLDAMLESVRKQLIRSATKANAFMRWAMYGPSLHEELDAMVDYAMLEEYNAQLPKRDSHDHR